MSIRVVIADDQAMIRTGFRLIMEAQEDITVVGEAADGVEALTLVRELRPDVCLMDVRMPGLDGIDATRRIAAEPGTRDTKVVVVTTFDLDEYVYGALRAGAVGFVLKKSGPRVLVDAVRAAVDGAALLSPTVTVRLLDAFARPGPDRTPELIEPLTPREREVVLLVARGATNTEIAEGLFISMGTVKSHLTRIQQKLSARNRVEIAAWAWEHGLVA
ncbi:MULTISPECIES: response regulator [Actinoalloteichus]|uniref:Two component transcriptional regulator, LuxR family n=1 Tax=Actinoalloteichus fjordicus TaxID=1612552 RepID=A0AAC9L8Y7_9PSEU|nr:MULTISPECIES: response regulator transcription factor [Actinoalloteichus]APU13287.1 two component transcriptional regulator, LuxR family [Actinoalloteichus fjordicus]APU19238.1 two component transcriptional regulator, LuxR family [Actinoalloteichus sp. GBA129-24]